LATTTHAPDHLVLFDGVCNLCNGSVQFIIAHDKRARFRFAALQSAAAQALLRNTAIEPAGMDTVVYLKHGRLLTRSTAALHILKDMGFPWSMAVVFLLVPKVLRDALYGFIARNRYRWFGKQESCMLPTPELRARFL
jgi:predicted DCC family thiol-disulfide oxidoreductase YuxK